MEDQRTTVRHKILIDVDFDRDLFRMVYRDRWDPYENCPIEESGKWVYLMRKVINSDYSRIQKLDDILKEKNRAIVFYNFSYELEMLRSYCECEDLVYAEWNGERHQTLPSGERWLYLVQYAAGCEGWNCITTDTIIFFSQTYSYRMLEQASGRIDRINTPYKDLYYYHLRSSAFIDLAIYRKLKNKQNFNESSLKFSKRS
jgi:superfamily II DNA or RNA helicase